LKTPHEHRDHPAHRLPPARQLHPGRRRSGDPELLTLKALKAIQGATLLLVDDLVSDAIVGHAAPTARVVYVGKRGGCQSTRRHLSRS